MNAPEHLGWGWRFAAPKPQTTLRRSVTIGTASENSDSLSVGGSAHALGAEGFQTHTHTERGSQSDPNHPEDDEP
jgi:hypothetical protein